MAITIKGFCLVLVMMSLTVLMGCSRAANIYKVGGSEGWIAKADNTYYDWAEQKEFHVGDSLIFEYDRNVNDVTQVSSALEYRICSTPTPPKAVYNTGHDVVTLTEPGYHYFISSNHAQCIVGQRLVVFVLPGQSYPIPPPPPSNMLPIGNSYKVGDSNEWRVPKESDFYGKWSGEKRFHVGDSLLFYYDDEVNDVLEVSRDVEFSSCDPSSPVAVHNMGQDLIRLTKPGIRYFITSKTGHCKAGLKLRVVVRPLFKAPSPKSPSPNAPSPNKAQSPKAPSPKAPSPNKAQSPKPPSPKAPSPKAQSPKAPSPKTSPKAPSTKAPSPCKSQSPKAPSPKALSPKTPSPEAPLAKAPSPKAVQPKAVPKKMLLSPLDRLIRWLQTFRPQPHH